jgi:hypothetical protein
MSNNFIAEFRYTAADGSAQRAFSADRGVVFAVQNIQEASLPWFAEVLGAASIESAIAHPLKEFPRAERSAAGLGLIKARLELDRAALLEQMAAIDEKRASLGKNEAQ